KVEDQLFPGVRLQEPTSEPEQPAQCSDRYHEPDGQAKDGRLGLREGGRQYRLDEAGDRVRSDNAVDGDLQRQRRQELKGDRQQTEQQDAGQVGSTRFGLAQEATAKREVAVSAGTHYVSLETERSRAWQTASVAAAHSRSVRSRRRAA